MTPAAKNAETVIVNGIAVERRLMESRAVRRCELTECQAHCCSCGVYLEVGDAKRILEHQDSVLPHVEPDRRDPAQWFDWNLEPDDDHPNGGTLAATNVAPDSTHPAGQSCVFLRRDRKCALQVASLAAGKGPWHLKPFYCALFPLVFHQRTLILDDENIVYLEGGSCMRSACAEPVPLFRLFAAEIKLAVGEAGYAEFAALAGEKV